MRGPTLYKQIFIHANTNMSRHWPSHSVSELKWLESVFTLGPPPNPLLNTVSANIARLVTHIHPSWPRIHTPLGQTHTVELNSFSVNLHTHTLIFSQIWTQYIYCAEKCKHCSFISTTLTGFIALQEPPEFVCVLCLYQGWATFICRGPYWLL